MDGRAHFEDEMGDSSRPPVQEPERYPRSRPFPVGTLRGSASDRSWLAAASNGPSWATSGKVL